MQQQPQLQQQQPVQEGPGATAGSGGVALAAARATALSMEAQQQQQLQREVEAALGAPELRERTESFSETCADAVLRVCRHAEGESGRGPRRVLYVTQGEAAVAQLPDPPGTEAVTETEAAGAETQAKTAAVAAAATATVEDREAVAEEETHWILGSDDATSCHIVCTYCAASRRVGCAHVDSEEMATEILPPLLRLTAAGAYAAAEEGETVQVFVMGGYRGHAELTQHVAQLLRGAHAAVGAPSLTLCTFCCGEDNTNMEVDDAPGPRFRGAALVVTNPAREHPVVSFVPAQFVEDMRGPAYTLRVVRCFGGQSSASPNSTESTEEQTLRRQGFVMTPRSGFRFTVMPFQPPADIDKQMCAMLSMVDDTTFLRVCSTTPKHESAQFLIDGRRAFATLAAGGVEDAFLRHDSSARSPLDFQFDTAADQWVPVTSPGPGPAAAAAVASAATPVDTELRQPLLS